jgi:hypothetical protein
VGKDSKVDTVSKNENLVLLAIKSIVFVAYSYFIEKIISDFKYG